MAKINRITCDPQLNADGSWSIVLTGWKANTTVAWTRRVNLSTSDSATIPPEMVNTGVCLLAAVAT